MSADVYVLASPAPVLWVYPSQVHPSAPVSGGGGNWYPSRIQHPPEEPERRRDDEDVLALLLLGAL